MTLLTNSTFIFSLLAILGSAYSYISNFEPRPEIGYPAGLLPECPGVTKNATITPAMMKMLQVTVHKITDTGQIVRKNFPVFSAHRSIAMDKGIDLKNKKTVFYAVGWFESSISPQSQAIGTAYFKRGYNVFIAETFVFTYPYPTSVRLTKVIGKKMGEFLVKLTEFGLEAENLELIGFSLGAHIASHAAKYFYSATGKKPSRVTGLDPAGPCYRALPPEERLDISDAHKVDILHTNIDGFGIAEPLGHLDFYANGGEYQPNDILEPYMTCLILCSHFKAFLYWWQAIEHPKKFVGVRCDSVQSARLGKCFENTTDNYLGFAANFSKPGIYYLPTHNEFPYYKEKGRKGIKFEEDIVKSVIERTNSVDIFVAE